MTVKKPCSASRPAIFILNQIGAGLSTIVLANQWKGAVFSHRSLFILEARRRVADSQDVPGHECYTQKAIDISNG